MQKDKWWETLFGAVVLMLPYMIVALIVAVLMSGCATTCPPGKNCVGEHASSIGGWGGIFGGF